VNFETTDIQKLFDIAPLQTFGDWAWVPGLSWSPDQTALFSVDHPAQDGSASAESSPNFDVAVLPLLSSPTINLVSQAGMFAYPVPSQAETLPTGEIAYQVAYLQAIFPSQSETSRYLLMVMDRDGSNRKQLFPESGAPGLDPQRVVWTPGAGSDEDSYDLAFIYQGNLWLVNTQTGLSRQLSGDGLVSRIDWK
jgi:resuscitation-promoting factor RpfB